MVVQIALGGECIEALSKNASGEFFGRRLPVASGYGDEGNV